MIAKIKLIEKLLSLDYLPKLEQALLTCQQKTSDNYQDHAEFIKLIDAYNEERVKGDKRH